MRKVYLHGALGKKYGNVFEMDVDTAAEAVRALAANFPTIIGDIQPEKWHLVRGEDVESGMGLDESHIVDFRLGKGSLHILPAATGRKENGLFKAVLGVTLIAFSFGAFGAFGSSFLGSAIAPAIASTTWGTAIGSIGLGMALSGVSSMLTSEPKVESNDAQKNDIFSSLTPNAQEGDAVPVIYGETVTRGTLISTILEVEDKVTAPSGTNAGVAANILTWFPNSTAGFTNGE